MANLKHGTTIGGYLAFHSGNSIWSVARTLTLTGDVTGNVTFDGSGNISLSTTVGDNSHSHTSAFITDATDANNSSTIVKRNASGGFSAGIITSTGAIMTGNILPNVASTVDLGSVALPFREIHADELFLSANSLYVNNKKVIHDDSSTITVSTSVDQDLRLKTTGLGDINVVSENTVTTQGNGGLIYNVPVTFSGKNIDFNNYSVGGDISFNANGVNGSVQLYSTTAITLIAPTVSVSSDITFGGGITTGSLGTNGIITFNRTSDGTLSGRISSTADSEITILQSRGTASSLVLGNGVITQTGNSVVTGSGSFGDNVATSGDYLIDSRVMVSNYSWGGANNNTWVGTTNTTVTGVAVHEGNYNTAIGVNTLAANTTGYSNAASGVNALRSNTVGYFNTASGRGALTNNTIGYYNTANGATALTNNTTGYFNTANGTTALTNNTTGYYNTANGVSAGRYIESGLANETPNTSLYIGANTKAKLANGSNEIVVGYDTIGNGSNTATWGNTAITNHYFSGSGSFGGTVSTLGFFTSNTYFESSDSAVVLATTGAGSVYLRPNGKDTGLGALSVNSSGNLTVAGSGSFGDNVTLADIGTESANVYFKLAALNDGRLFRGSGGMWLGSGDAKLMGMNNSGIPTYYTGGTFETFYHTGNFIDNSTNWNTAHGWGNHTGLYSLVGDTYSGSMLPFTDTLSMPNPTTGGWLRIATLPSSVTLSKYVFNCSGDNTHCVDELTLTQAGYGMYPHIIVTNSNYNTSKIVEYRAISSSSASGVELWVRLNSISSSSGSITVYSSIALNFGTIVASPTVSTGSHETSIVCDRADATSLLVSGGVKSNKFEVVNGASTQFLKADGSVDSNSYDNYSSWNLKTNGVQRTTIGSNGTLNLVAGTNTSLSYSAGGVVTINSTASGGDYLALSGGTISGKVIMNSTDYSTRYNGGGLQILPWGTTTSTTSLSVYNNGGNLRVKQTEHSNPTAVGTGNPKIEIEYGGTVREVYHTGIFTNNSSNWDTAYTHSTTITGNPHNLDSADIGAIASNGTIGMDANLNFNNLSVGKRGIYGTMADNDFWFVGGVGVSSSNSYFEIATGDDGQTAGSAEEIRVSQYGPGNPLSGTLVRTAKILDVNGNTSFPGTVTAATFSGNASTATKLATARTIDITGDITATAVAFDGTTNIAISASVNNDSHTHDTRYYTETEMTNRTVSPKVNSIEAKEIILTDSGGVAKYKIIYNATDDSLETIKL